MKKTVSPLHAGITRRSLSRYLTLGTAAIASGSSISFAFGGSDSIDAEHCLKIAKQCESWIESQRIDTANGLGWTFSLDMQDRQEHSFYYGSAGIILFYIELYKADPQEKYLQRITGAADDLLAFLSQRADLGPSWAGGFPGIVYSLASVAALTGDKKYADGARAGIDKLIAQSQALGNGIGWITDVPFFKQYKEPREVLDADMGAAGAGMMLVWAAENKLHKNAKAWAIQIADRLIEVGEAMPIGKRWNMTEPAIDWHTPNFSHGGGGVGYFLARVYQLTGDQRYLDSAVEAARYIKSIAVSQEQGVLIPHGGEEDLFYLSHCHGPAGTGKLFYLLGQLTDDSDWTKSTHQLMQGLFATGAPESRSRGFWNNISQCCGDAGIGDYALQLYRHGENSALKSQYLNYAKHEAEALIKRSSRDANGRYWLQAEHRSLPEYLQAQTGYMQGAAGVGSFFLHLSQVLKQVKPTKLVLPNSPFGHV